MFRFETLDIWKEGITITRELLSIGDDLERKKLFRFAEQLRGAAMSITNNIAEGSGSFHEKEFCYFLNISRRSIFECFNILVILLESDLITDSQLSALRRDLDQLSRKISSFRGTLMTKLDSMP